MDGKKADQTVTHSTDSRHLSAGAEEAALQ